MPSIQAFAADINRRLRSSSPFTKSRLLAKLKGKESFGLAGLDSRVIEHIGLRNGYYVELGASDGIRQSNTLQLELFYGWSGTLIEPVSGTFMKLRRNRSARRNHLVEAACVGFDYQDATLDLVYSTTTTTLMTTAIGIESDIDHPWGHARGPGSDAGLHQISVRALTLTEVLRQARAPKTVDFLSLDVEGAELQVLKGIDFSAFHISWILIEARKIDVIKKFLGPIGYELHAQLSHHDFLFRFEQPDN